MKKSTRSSVPFRRNALKRKSKTFSDLRPIRPLSYLHLRSCESTQDLIQSVSSGWFLLWADRQQAGRGTQDRTWVSPPGGLYYSLAFPADLVSGSDPIVLLGAANLWKKTLSEQFPDADGGFSLKWPNDLLHDGRKLGGFLANKRSGMFYVGVGINVNNTIDSSREDLRRPAVSLTEITGLDHSPRDLLLDWTDRFYDTLTETDGDPFDADRLEPELSTVGKTVDTERGRGTAVGLGADGELEVEVDGERIAVHSPDNVEVTARETRR